MDTSSLLDRQREHLSVDVDGGEERLPATKISVRRLVSVADTGEPILVGVNMEVPRGQIAGVIGPSGSGKSTLLRALNRLWEPPSGTVYLDGVDVCGIDVVSLRRRVGMLFQLPALFEGTVADNVRYGPSLIGKKLTESEVAVLLSLADLDPTFADRNGSDLSVGQAQRVALARTLANDPEVLLLDEPTSALDPISTQNIEEAILKLRKVKALTVVMVSHDVKQMQRLADVIFLVVGGEVVEVLDPSRMSEANHPMAKRFLELSSKD